MNKIFSFGLALLSLGLVGCSHGDCHCKGHGASAERDPSSQITSLPDQARWTQFYQTAETLSLVAPNTTLKMSSGGTSVYAVINVDGRDIGALLPENAATSVPGEIVAFNLARAVGVADIYRPGAYKLLSGENLIAFKNLIPKTPYSKLKWKEQNRVSVLNRIAENPQGIPAVYKSWDSKPSDYDALVNVNANTLNSSHVLKGSSVAFSKFLKCDGAKPSADVTVSINGGATSELEAARQVSSIFLIDALTQQWDRFSGGNLQTVTKDGKVSFIAYDNGGTWNPASTAKTLKLVTRFDRSVSAKILALDDFFQKKSAFEGIQSDDEMIVALDLSKFPSKYETLKKTTRSVADHIRANAECFF